MLLKENKLKQIINKKKTVITVVEELSVSRQSIHKWLSRYKRFGINGLITKKKTGCKKAHNRTTVEIEQLIIQISKKYWNDGVETLHDYLLYENNVELNPSTIYRTLNEKGLRFGFRPADSLETMQYKLTLFLHYYNWRKKHRGLGMDGVTPVERLKELGSVNLTLQCYMY